jgi:hypothetical protein
MSEHSCVINYALDTVQSIPEVEWIELEQAEIPLDQEVAKENDVYSMFSMASMGQSARAYRSGRCPVQRSFQGDKIVARATLQFYVHHSADLEYTIEPSEGQLSQIPIIVYRNKNEYIETEYKEQFKLGWLPLDGTFVAFFKSPSYDKKRKLVKNPEVVQDDGFLYIKGSVWSALQVSGIAVFDKWSLTIEHEQGKKFNRKIFVDAVWFEGEEKKSERLELKVSKCLEDEFNTCPYDADPFDLTGDGQGNGSDYWNFRLNYSSALIVYSGCNGEVLKIYEDEEI